MALRMGLILAILCSTLVESTSSSSSSSSNNGGEGGPNSPLFNFDHTALEKNIAAIFNKVAHSSATTKRSVPAYEAQVSVSTTLSTIASPLTTPTSPSVPSIRNPIPRITSVSPTYRELPPSYAPPSRAPFTPPLPPEYLNPFADKPTLRGTNSDTSHVVQRRPIPPPSLTPIQQRIPIRPPDLIQDPIQDSDKFSPGYSSNLDSSLGYSKNNIPSLNNNNNNNDDDNNNYSPSSENNDKKIDNNNNNKNDYVPTLHITSITRILSGSNGRKQDIPEILLKPLSTKMPIVSSNNNNDDGNDNIPAISTTEKSTTIPTTAIPISSQTGTIHSTHPTIFNLPNTRRKQHHHDDDDDDDEEDINDDDDDDDVNERGGGGQIKTEEIEIVDAERLPYPQPQPPAPSKRPNDLNRKIISNPEKHPLESAWRIAWCLHVYIAATMFTIMALYSIYKIVRFNESNNLLTQSYFLTVHLLLTTVCTLRCFHLFYDAYNLGHSLSEPISQVLLNLPAPLLSTAFATLFLYLSKCSGAPSLNTKFLSPTSITLCSILHITICLSLHISDYIIREPDLSSNNPTRLLPLICQCIYIVICVGLGLFYMYIYRVVRTQINFMCNKTIGPNITVGHDPTTIALNSAITTSIATALLFIVMGFLQLYGIFGIHEKFKPYPWLWWGWQFSVRLLELSICGLLAWVTSLSQYPLREKQIQQHSTHSGFALFPCGSSTSTENMDDAMYPAICSSNQAMQNYTMRTGKQVYDDSFPLNTLPTDHHLNISGTFERHSIRKSGTMTNFPHHSGNNGNNGNNGRGSINRHGNGVQTLRGETTRHSIRHNNILPETLPVAAGATGSTMLVAEDGFVRFRSLGAEEDDDLSDSQSIVGTHGRGSGSLSGSVRYSTRHNNNINNNSNNSNNNNNNNSHQYQQQQHLHNNNNHHHHHHHHHHQSHHQLYNNT